MYILETACRFISRGKAVEHITMNHHAVSLTASPPETTTSAKTPKCRRPYGSFLRSKICCLYALGILAVRCCYAVADATASGAAADRSIPSVAPPAASYETTPFPPPGVNIWDMDDFLLTRRLGTGKFSDVFEAVDVRQGGSVLGPDTSNHKEDTKQVARRSTSVVDPRTLVVVKCLKPVSERKIRREVSVLIHASNLPNMARLLGIVVPLEYYADNRGDTDLPQMPSLVLEHAGPHSQWLCHGRANTELESTQAFDSASSDEQTPQLLSEFEIRYYLCHLLVALEALHKSGLMHRDVKPRTVLINRRGRATHRPLTLVDLGLADFYRPHQKYNVRVASRHYKSPELLIGYEYYSYPIDMWGVGCILAGLLLRREPLFRGKDNIDQLRKIVTVLGTADLIAYMQRNSIPPQSAEIESILRNTDNKYPRQRQNVLILLSDGCPVPSSDGLDLLNKLLVYDHGERLTATQAMQHRFFDPVRERVHKEVRNYNNSVSVV